MGQWVFGGVERESGKCFKIPVPNRTAEVLLKLIVEWILPGRGEVYQLAHFFNFRAKSLIV